MDNLLDPLNRGVTKEIFMQMTVLTQAVAVALATFGMGAAFAQSSLTLYGNADVSVDHVSRSAGGSLLTGTTVIPQLGNRSAAAATAGTKASLTRVSPSATSQTSYGLKGTEDMGGGYKASFVLEGQLSHDTGALAQDGRFFGRQSYVGLTTPFGEVRLGRQYAPIFYSTAFITGERFGATDLFIEGGASNNLMVRQDNQISYWLKVGGLTASVAYSPDAGSNDLITNARGSQVSSTNGGLLGSASAGAETSGSKNGRSMGLFANYAFNEALNVTFGYHHNDFDGAQFGLYSSTANAVLATSSFRLDDYAAYNLGAKYIVPGSNIMISGTYGTGKYDMTAGSGHLKLSFLAAGVRVPVDAWTISAQVSQAKFNNFTEGKDTGVMLGAEYALSKRTSLFARWVQIKDDEGQAADVGFNPAFGGIVGGPDVIATTFGFRETPVFAGGGINAGGKTTYLGAGIRHTF
jgi:predicted porin